MAQGPKKNTHTHAHTHTHTHKRGCRLSLHTVKLQSLVSNLNLLCHLRSPQTNLTPVQKDRLGRMFVYSVCVRVARVCVSVCVTERVTMPLPCFDHSSGRLGQNREHAHNYTDTHNQCGWWNLCDGMERNVNPRTAMNIHGSTCMLHTHICVLVHTHTHTHTDIDQEAFAGVNKGQWGMPSLYFSGGRLK